MTGHIDAAHGLLAGATRKLVLARRATPGTPERLAALHEALELMLQAGSAGMSACAAELRSARHHLARRHGARRSHPRARAMSKRSIMLRGRKTSISLEGLFWTELRAIAAYRRLTVSQLVTAIDARQHGFENLSSAVRVFVLCEVLARGRIVSPPAAPPVAVPSPLAGEGARLAPQAQTGEGSSSRGTHPSPVTTRPATEQPSPARGEGATARRSP